MVEHCTFNARVESSSLSRIILAAKKHFNVIINKNMYYYFKIPKNIFKNIFLIPFFILELKIKRFLKFLISYFIFFKYFRLIFLEIFYRIKFFLLLKYLKKYKLKNIKTLLKLKNCKLFYAKISNKNYYLEKKYCFLNN